MGGNSPSHLTHEEGEAGVTLVKGIRLSDRVIHRMRQPAPIVRPQSSQQQGPPPHAPETQIPSAENVTHPPAAPLEAPSLPPSAEPAPPPMKLVPPPPVQFHSLPPASVEPIATLPPPPPPAETKAEPVSPAPTPLSPSISPEVEANVEPVSPPPPTPSLEPVDLPPPEPLIPPLIEPVSPPAQEKVIEPLVLPPPVESSTAAAAPPEPSAPPPLSEPVKPDPPPSTEPPVAAPVIELLETIIPPSPLVEVVQTPLSLEIPAPEPAAPPCLVDSTPAESEVVHAQVEPLVPAEDVTPAVHPPPPCELVPPPPLPEPVAAPSPAPEPPFEEPHPPSHCVELAVVPVDAPVSEHLVDSPAPPLSETAPAPEESTPILSLPQVVEDEVPTVASVPPPAQASPVSPEVVEEELRQNIKEEMQRSLEEEINKRRQELQQQLEEMRAQAQAEARAAALAQVEEQVKKTLEAEKAANVESLTDSLMKERMKTEDGRLMAQLYWMELKAHQLEEREKELKKRNTLYKEHVAKLEAKCAEFYKVTAESFQRGNEETRNRFARFTVQPVCGDLQSQILKCYRENAGKTLSCSGIASAYMQCVDSAKKNKLSTGG